MRGSEAVLPLGSLYISGDWDEYWQFHLEQEHKRNHLALYSSGIPLMKQVLKARCSSSTLFTSVRISRILPQKAANSGLYHLSSTCTQPASNTDWQGVS